MNSLIRFMIKNKVATQVVTVLLIISGLYSYTKISKAVFPDLRYDIIQIKVNYPGATPGEIERSIVKYIEEAIRSVDEIKDVNARIYRGTVVMQVTLNRGVDKDEKKQLIQSRIDSIKTFPKLSEKPVVEIFRPKRQLLRIIFYGNAEPTVLKELVYQVRDDISKVADISGSNILGVQDYQISVHVDKHDLQSHQLSIDDIASVVSRNSLDIPSGVLKTDNKHYAVHVKGQNYYRHEYSDLLIRSQGEQKRVRLSDVADIQDGFEENNYAIYYNGQRAAILEVQYTSHDNVLENNKRIQNYLSHSLYLPKNIHYSLWSNEADNLITKLGLLVVNGAEGILLVFILLVFALNIRTAFWASFGIVFSFVASLIVMYILDISINQISLFGFVLATGIVVDDAIVVAENIALKVEQGLTGMRACFEGVTEIARPVIFSVLTTTVAFVPIMFMPGILGGFMEELPKVVIAVLALSLFESLLILPSHLKKTTSSVKQPHACMKYFNGFHAGVNRRIMAWINGPFSKLVKEIIKYPIFFIIFYLIVIVLSVMLLKLNYVGVSFFPDVPGRFVNVKIELPMGASMDRTKKVVNLLQRSAHQASEAIAKKYNIPVESVIYGQVTSYGQHGLMSRSLTNTMEDRQIQSNYAMINIKLPDNEERSFSSKDFESYWRQFTGSVPEAKSIKFSSASLNVADPITIELSSRNKHTLNQATDELERYLLLTQGVSEISDSRNTDNQEIHIRLLPKAHYLGIDLTQVGNQVRASIHGKESQRIVRDVHEIKVYVKTPSHNRNGINDLMQMKIKIRDGVFVPLGAVAQIYFSHESAMINRHNRKRITTVKANVDVDVTSADTVNRYLAEDVLPKLQKKYHELDYLLSGEEEQKSEIMPYLGKGFMFSILLIFSLIALNFNSYWFSSYILAMIPLAVVGSIWGHWLIGLPIGFLSFIGVIGLSGIIINNGIILVDAYKNNLLLGKEKAEAIILATVSRTRPMLITSLTTFLGMTPILLETSMQAQYLKPTAVTIGFGILVGTLLLLLTLPAILMLCPIAKSIRFDFDT